MDKLENAFIDFFSFLPHLANDWIFNAKESATVLKSLCNQCEQLQLVSKAQWNSELIGKFPDIKERLVLKIRSGIFEEELKLNKILESLACLRDKLAKKSDYVERCSYKLNLTNCTTNASTSFDNLLELSEDVNRYYNNLFLQLTFVLGSVDYLNESSIKALRDAFLESSLMEPHIQDIISSTKCVINK